MLIVYCEICGLRIPPGNFDGGGAVRLEDNRALCPKCAPLRGTFPTPAGRDGAPAVSSASSSTDPGASAGPVISKPAKPPTAVTPVRAPAPQTPAVVAATVAPGEISVKAAAARSSDRSAKPVRGSGAKPEAASKSAEKRKFTLAIAGVSAGLLLLVVGLIVSINRGSPDTLARGSAKSGAEGGTDLTAVNLRRADGAEPETAKTDGGAFRNSNPRTPENPPQEKASANAVANDPALRGPAANLPADKPPAPALALPPSGQAGPAPAPAVAPPPPVPVAPPASVAPAVPAAPPAAVTPAPGLLSESQRATLLAFDPIFSWLGKAELEPAARLEGALRVARGVNGQSAGALAALLEKSQALHKRALENLAKKPPSEPVQIVWNKLELKGPIVRVDGGKAWIRSAQGVEAPVDLAALPLQVLLKSLAADEGTPQGLSERAAFVLAFGNLDEAQALCRRIKKEERPEWAGVLDERARLERLRRFEKAVTEIESAVPVPPRALEAVRKEFADLSAEHKDRLEQLARRIDSGKESAKEGHAQAKGEAKPAPKSAAADDRAPVKAGLWASYWDNEFKTLQLARAETKLNWDVGDAAPDPKVSKDFGIRYAGLLFLQRAGKYQYQFSADDAIEICVNRGKPLKDKGWINMPAGYYEIKIEYKDTGGGAKMNLKWKLEGVFDWQEIPASALFHDIRQIQKYQSE